MRLTLVLAVLLVIPCWTCRAENVGYVEVDGLTLTVAGQPHYFVGVNFWYGLNLASNGPGGDRARLERELDSLSSLGVTNLRIMAGSEGPDTEPWRMIPSLQTSPGVYDADVLDGLDYLLKAMDDRELRAVMCLTNFWQWSGGMAQYVSWNGGGPIPYPPPEPGGDWNVYQDYASDFYSNAGAKQDFRDHITFIVNRVNPHTGVAYRDDPTIMSWELGNEPRGYNNNAVAFNQWVDDTAAYIKSLDSNHLVTTGCEGDTPWPSWNGLDFIANHDGPDIDYATVHIWPQNWGWYDPANPGGTYATSEANARAYFNAHEAEASGVLGKPFVLEEFGLARDGGSYDPASSTVWKDTFYGAMYDEVHASAAAGGGAVGDNIWAWGGEGRPSVPYGSLWAAGDDWIGDPPHEHQGWYSVYDSDSSTLAVMSSHVDELADLVPPEGFVTVSGNHFVLDGEPYLYAGFNNYYQMVYAADLGLRHYVEEVQTEGADMGLTVLRTWAFNDGAGQWNALQTAPGVYQEYVFQGLDYALHLADQNGLKVVLAFVNNWDDYGGMNQYVSWSGTASSHDHFYTDANCRTWYKNHISTVLNRVNTFNGRVYKEDPTVFAWELANEPRCESDTSGATLQAWIAEMSAYVKGIDPWHMVTTGSEGFYGPSGPNHNPVSWMQWVGVDFIPNHDVSSIDFACAHIWPDWWGTNYTQSMAWIRDHIDDSDDLLGKPVILEEFGKQQPLVTRDLFYQGWYDEIYSAAQAGEAAGGSNLWILYHDDYPDYDGFGVYCPEHTSTISIIINEAERINGPIPPVVSGVLIENLTLGHTDDYIKDGDAARITATVTDNNPAFGISNITADLSGLGGGAAVNPDTYAGNLATWTGTVGSVACSPADGTVSVTVSALDLLGNPAAPGSDTITADNTPPTAVTDFEAVPGHEQCGLSWTMGTDLQLAGVTVRRTSDADEYPEYPLLVASWPSFDSFFPGDHADGTETYTGSGTSWTDAVADRNIYYYQAFCYDAARNYGAADETARGAATNYWLGDVSSTMGSWGYNGFVGDPDIDKLGGAYAAIAPPAPDNQCDVGPTVNPEGSSQGLPLPDGLVEFEDLMAFAMNYSVVGPRETPVLPAPDAGRDLALSLAEHQTDAGGEVEVAVVLEGNAAQVKGVSTTVAFDPGGLEFVSAELSEDLSGAPDKVFFWYGAGVGTVGVDLAVLGRGATIGGPGELAVLRFRALSDDGGLSFVRAALRGAENEDLTAVITGCAPSNERPTSYRLVGNVPNPFNPATNISFDVPEVSHVTVRVYSPTGRLVRTLVDDEVDPGRHEVMWNGRDSGGRFVGSGVYLCFMEAGGSHHRLKMVLLK
jgi:mannan endo-1,4-beta-mannosidase